MRSRQFATKLFAGAMAAWFGVVTAVPALLHECPRAMAAEMAGAMPAGHAGHAMHHEPSRDDGAPVPCQCLGSCAVAGPAVLPVATGLLGALVSPIIELPLRVGASEAAAEQPDHLQPFATPPPHPHA